MNRRLLIIIIVTLLTVSIVSAFSFSFSNVGKENIVFNWSVVNESKMKVSVCNALSGSGGSVDNNMYYNFEHCVVETPRINVTKSPTKDLHIYVRPGRRWFCMEDLR